MSLLASIQRNGSHLPFDPSEWSEAIGEGGFGSAFASARHPNFVLKQIDGCIEERYAIDEMRKLAKHARVMDERLSQIIADEATNEFARRSCETLRRTLTSHVGYDATAKHIYLLQQRAPGESLEALLREDPPTWAVRLNLAKDLASAMVSLRRCRVVHLDQRPVNVYVDLHASESRVTLIDLDGCGVLRNQENLDSFWCDAWDIPPITLGRPDDMATPPWFPIDPTWQNPISGHFKFAERWCLVNEVWRMLSWGMPALGWLPPSFDEMLSASELVRTMFRAGSSYLARENFGEQLKKIQMSVASQFRDALRDAERQTRSIDWADFIDGIGQAEIQYFLTQFALFTLFAFLDPKDMRLPEVYGSPGKHEIPSAQWVQNSLFRYSRAEQ